MRRYRGIMLWTAVSLVIASVLAVGCGWWALSRHASTVGDYLPARAAWMVARLGADGRTAAVSSLLGAADYDLRIQDPAWRDLITGKLDGSPEEQVLMLDLLRNAFSYGEEDFNRGVKSPERERVFRLTASPDRSVCLAARRCWRSNQHEMGEQAYRTTTALVLSDDPVPASPIAPDGWRPGRPGLFLLRGDLLGWVGDDEASEAQVKERFPAVLDGMMMTSSDRRDQVLLLSHLLWCDRSSDGEVQQNEWIALLLQRLMANDQWIDDIWERDTTTALLLARSNLLWHAVYFPEIRPLCDRFLAGTIRWCLAQDPHRLPEWKANGQAIPAGDLERFGAWLIATHEVFGLHTWSAADGLSPQTRAMAAPVTLPVLVDVIPDPERCTPFGLSLTMQRLWSECTDPDGPPRPEWRQWDIRTREWVELRQTMTLDHRAPDGTWPTRGEVDTVWETLFMGTITDGAPSEE